VVGTVGYMAPEVVVINKLNVDQEVLKKHLPNIAYDPEKVDIFTVGVTFFMLIFNGQPPFSEASKHDKLYDLIIG